MNKPLPDFERPPVSEVAISLQFKSLDTLRSSHLGLFWASIRDRGFTRVEEYPPLVPQYEQFEEVTKLDFGLEVQSFPDSVPPRAWFVNDEQHQLIQIQRDRIVFNWRQGVGSEPYPRFAKIFKHFQFALEQFESFVNQEQLGAIFPDQCEVTYVNFIPLENDWSHAADLHKVVTLWHGKFSEDFLSPTEDVSFYVRFRMKDKADKPVGRLHVTLQRSLRTSDMKPMYVLTLTGRGKPSPPDLKGARMLIESEHEWIVRGFAAVTTAEMHKYWGRKDGC